TRSKRDWSSDVCSSDLSLNDNILSVYINHVEEREYIYELYKDGKTYKSSEPTTERYFAFQLDEPAKYRIRVNLTNEEVNPRFSRSEERRVGNEWRYRTR